MGLVFRKSYHMIGSPRLSDIIKCMMQTADAQTDAINGLWDKMQKENLTWFILQHDMDIYHHIAENAVVEIETEPIAYNTFFTYRLFNVYVDDVLCITSLFKFAMVNRKERQIVRVVQELISPYGVEKMSRPLAMAKMKPSEEKMFVKRFVIDETVIDLNGHVNNAAYFEFVLEHQQQLPEKICVSYDKELLRGDRVDMYVSGNENEALYTLECNGKVMSKIGVYAKK